MLYAYLWHALWVCLHADPPTGAVAPQSAVIYTRARSGAHISHATLIDDVLEAVVWVERAVGTRMWVTPN